MSSFDPARYITKIARRQKTDDGYKMVASDYLEVKWRLLWFRTEHPDGHIAVEVVSLTSDAAVMRATVSWPDGGSSSDIGSETAGDWKDFTEKAATKAIGRALASLGYGVQFCGDHEFDDGSGERVVDAPVARPKAAMKQAMPAAAAVPAKAAPAAPADDWKHLVGIARRVGITTAAPLYAEFKVSADGADARARLLKALPVEPDADGLAVIDWGAVEDRLRYAVEDVPPADAVGAEQPEMIPAGRAYH